MWKSFLALLFTSFLACLELVTASNCTGHSVNLEESQCNAFIEFYHATDGLNWDGNGYMCTDVDPCACGPLAYGITCNDKGTKITQIELGDSNLNGTIPESFSAFKNLNYLRLADNKLKGTAMPALDFAKITSCFLLAQVGDNEFTCPWPEGVTKYCEKVDWEGNYYPIKDSDCHGKYN